MAIWGTYPWYHWQPRKHVVLGSYHGGEFRQGQLHWRKLRQLSHSLASDGLFWQSCCSQRRLLLRSVDLIMRLLHFLVSVGFRFWTQIQRSFRMDTAGELYATDFRSPGKIDLTSMLKIRVLSNIRTDSFSITTSTTRVQAFATLRWGMAVPDILSFALLALYRSDSSRFWMWLSQFCFDTSLHLRFKPTPLPKTYVTGHKRKDLKRMDTGSL